MHLSAYNSAKDFELKYCANLQTNAVVLDFGSYDHNGSLKPIFSRYKYIGVDIEHGPNVDLVIQGRKTPLLDNSIDVITSSSCFEHDEMFWVTFLEMCRLVKPNGFIYLNAPSTGPYHAYPIDCWRFQKDSYKALETWANYSNYKIELVESYICEENQFWLDNVGIFKKLPK